ncbi:MAG TPA: hypothetical protein VJZ50_07775 [Candidatus Limnocylindrales bacterium]|nr:hypothetical protein [Candidatus Limnocylindrales bacterium]
MARGLLLLEGMVGALGPRSPAPRWYDAERAARADAQARLRYGASRYAQSIKREHRVKKSTAAAALVISLIVVGCNDNKATPSPTTELQAVEAVESAVAGEVEAVESAVAEEVEAVESAVAEEVEAVESAAAEEIAAIESAAAEASPAS